MSKTAAVADEHANNYIERFNRWKGRGPLYRFRKSTGMTMGTVASAVGVSIGTVQNLEDGNRSPVDKPYFAALARLLQTKPAELRVEWEQWLKSKPAA